MRQSREELIKRGVLKEIYDKGKRLAAGHRPRTWQAGPINFWFIKILHIKPADSAGKGRENIAEGTKDINTG